MFLSGSSNLCVKLRSGRDATMFFKGLIFVFFYVAVTVFSLKNGTCKTFYFEKCLLCPYGETEQFEILCDNAKLKDIPDAFKEFEALKISNDDIIILPSLRNFSKLIRLDLNYDGIRLVLDDAIANLASLIHLSLSHNHIIDLGSKTFEGLENLSYLSLASNSIYLIDSQLFTENNVPKLTYLYLNENNIVKVEKGSFHGLSNLVLLDLSMNRIESLEKFATHSHQLMSLKTLNLGYNKISQIPVDFFEFIPSLEQLSLEHNFLKSVSQPDFILLSGTLVIMNLQGNLISEVKSKCFQNLNKLEKIDLSHNQLKDLKIKALPDNKFSHDNISLTLLIYGNPINCSNCDNSWMVAYPTLKAVNHQNETLLVFFWKEN